jgi:very-short-patch-repair endonuclease
MAHDLAALLGPDGVARAADLTGRVDRHTVGEWVARGRMLRPYPGVLVLPSRATEWRTRAVAALFATDGLLSHSSALTVWRLAEESGAIHVSIPSTRRAPRGDAIVHRVQQPDGVRIGRFPVTTLPRSLVDTWGVAHGASGRSRDVDRARGAVITAVRERRLGVAQLRAELGTHPALPGRSALSSLIRLVEQGCQSELEIWGVREVLSGVGMPTFVQQYPVTLPFGTVTLDAAIPELKIAVELDGAAFHGSAEARERDLRRDAALAARGWIVLRFSYRRLTTEPDACRREILAVCRERASLPAGR